jgi:hypothetical protein
MPEVFMIPRNVLLVAMITTFIFSGFAYAQNPQNYHLIYGNRDASPFTVVPGSTILLPIWGATDPTPGSPDTVTFATCPLASRDLYVDLRLGGHCVYCPNFDSACSCTNPEPNVPGPGYTNQVLLDFAYLQGPDSICCFFTSGDTIQIGFFRMRVTANPAYFGQTVDVFIQGVPTLWGMQDGVRGVLPIVTFSQLYFSPCAYTCGDVNNDASFDGRDVTYAINYFKGIGPEPPYSCDCPDYDNPLLAADANGDCNFSGLDVTFSVNYLKGLGPAPRRCPGC